MKLGLLILFIPWLLAVYLQDNASYSFIVAWSGVVICMILVVTGKIVPLPNDLPITSQLLRPHFLHYVYFNLYMAVTPIFFYLDVMGYRNFEFTASNPIDYVSLEQTAKSQRFYALAHAGYACGLLWNLRTRINTNYKINFEKVNQFFFLRVSWVLLFVVLILSIVPGMKQFAIKLQDLSFISSIIAVTYFGREGKLEVRLASILVFGFNFLQIVFSGWKEPIIFTIMLLLIFSLREQRYRVLIPYSTIIIVILIFLPSYNLIFRDLSWNQGVENSVAFESAVQSISDSEIDVVNVNWEFLVRRTSEISMFNIYVDKVPSDQPYYGWDIITNSFLYLIPRVFWPGKPDVENQVMERTFVLGIVDRSSAVSAKPSLIADAYMSGGELSILLVLFLFGLLTSYISRLSEFLFCGVDLGINWIFLGIFQILIKGSCMEFLVNTVFWGAVTMIAIRYIMLRNNFIQKA